MVGRTVDTTYARPTRNDAGRRRARSQRSVRAERHCRHRYRGAGRRDRRACAAWSARAAPRSRGQSSAPTADRAAKSAFSASRWPAILERRGATGIGAYPGKPQAAGTGADPHGWRQHRACRAWRTCSRNGIFRPAIARKAARRHHPQAADRDAVAARPAQVLSGGNQQKVVIGKWLVAGARLFMLRRADPRHRRRRQSGNFRADRPISSPTAPPS